MILRTVDKSCLMNQTNARTPVVVGLLAFLVYKSGFIQER